THACARAGLSAVSVKLFAVTARAADSRTRAPGAHDQALVGIQQLQGVDRFALELRVPLSRSSLSDYADFAALARRIGVPQLRAEISLDGLGLRRLASAAEALAGLAGRCAVEGVALEVAPVAAGERLFQRMPAR
ncbi:MAG: hypothetical protein GXP55_18960, partial [Deltaproteobacteria bacterium]|nr:hypothetical protein [Deltaproteobacteria bacterium]